MLVRRLDVTSKTCAAFSRLPLLAPIASLLLACGGERMSLGSNEEDNSSNALEHCAGSAERNEVIYRQDQIDALLGCEVLDGSLRISQLEAAGESLSLTPLASLRRVTGSVELVGLDSLTGLEALEQVGNLALEQLNSDDLVALSHLQRVLWDPPGGGDGGVIAITGCLRLQGLAGLQGLTTWNSLFMAENPELVTLLDLAGPRNLRSLSLSELPALHDLHGLEFASEIANVIIDHTGIVSMNGLPLVSTQSLQIRWNSQLTDLRALNRLHTADQLEISDNDSLNSVELGSLSEVQSIRINGNDALTKIYAYGVTEGSAVAVRQTDESPEIVPLGRQLFEVGNNAKLQDLTGPDGFKRVQQVSVWGNPALTRLNLNHLERADGLEILDNPALRTLVVPLLERVGDLAVVNNPQLSTATLEDVQTFSRILSGNGDPMTPTAPPPAP
jgi:hypothetical protein